MKNMLQSMFDFEDSFKKDDGHIDWAKWTKFFRENTAMLNTETGEITITKKVSDNGDK